MGANSTPPSTGRSGGGGTTAAPAEPRAARPTRRRHNRPPQPIARPRGYRAAVLRASVRPALPAAARLSRGRRSNGQARSPRPLPRVAAGATGIIRQCPLWRRPPAAALATAPREPSRRSRRRRAPAAPAPHTVRSGPHHRHRRRRCRRRRHHCVCRRAAPPSGRRRRVGRGGADQARSCQRHAPTAARQAVETTERTPPPVWSGAALQAPKEERSREATTRCI